MNSKELLTENTIILLRHSKLVENKLVTYSKDKIYKASYIDSNGKENIVTLEPKEDMNIVEVIKYLQNKYNNFFKLYGVVETKTESIINLSEAADTETINDYKTYIIDKLGDNKKYIKATSEDKPNRYNENGIHLYGYDYYEEEDGKPFNGFQVYIPYNITKETLDKLIAQVNNNIDTIYKDSVDLR